MELEYEVRLRRDLRRLRDAAMRARVERTIADLEAASAITAISGVESIRGHSGRYRIRIGDYRLGIAVEGETVVLVRFLHRRDIYRYFP